MRRVIWIDEKGWKHCSLIRDEDPDHMAPSGIPLETLDLSRLDWEAIQLELNNLLVDRGLLSWTDVVESQNGVTASVLTVMKRKVIALYRTEDT